MSWNLPGEPRYGVHSIDHFALEVPSLADAEKFFTLFGLEVSLEAGAGAAAGYVDQAYRDVGVEVAGDRRELASAADVVFKVQAPSTSEVALLRSGWAGSGSSRRMRRFDLACGLPMSWR